MCISRSQNTLKMICIHPKQTEIPVMCISRSHEHIKNMIHIYIPKADRNTFIAYIKITEHTYKYIPKTNRNIFDAYQDHTNKFRDTRRFAKMNNPNIPSGHSLNILTGTVF